MTTPSDVVEVVVENLVVEVNTEANIVDVSAPGPQGPPGAAGAQGDKGDKGDKGDQGQSLRVLGSLPSGTLPEQFPGPLVPQPADAWIVGDEIYIYDGTEWVPSLRGPKGDKGDQGEVGPVGPPVDPSTIGRTYYVGSASEVWNIVHDLPGRPSIEVYTNDGEEIDADVQHMGPGEVRVSHGFAMTGFVRLI